MSLELRGLWSHLRSSLWFLPTATTVVAAVVVILALTFDPLRQTAAASWLDTAIASGNGHISSLLATVAGSIITLTGVVFSVTVLTLSLASNQFGPRLLRNFLRDRGNQWSLSILIATFVSLLLVMLMLGERPNDEAPVPWTAVLFVVGMTMVSVAALVYFIHHISLAIQADTVVDNVSRLLRQRIEKLYPEHDDGNGSRYTADDADASPPPVASSATRTTQKKGGRDSGAAAGAFGGETWIGESTLRARLGLSRTVMAPQAGRVQRVDVDALLKLLDEAGLTVEVLQRPGDVLLTGAPVMEVWPADELDERLERRLLATFHVGPERTEEQDIRFAFDQLVEVAVRALSPGTNDPYTAMNCIDRVGDGLVCLGNRCFPGRVRSIRGEPRLLLERVTYEEVVAGALDPLRVHAAAYGLVAAHLMRVIGEVASLTPDPSRRQVLAMHAERLLEVVNGNGHEPAERRRIRTVHQNIQEVFLPGERPAEGERASMPEGAWRFDPEARRTPTLEMGRRLRTQKA